MALWHFESEKGQVVEANTLSEFRKKIKGMSYMEGKLYKFAEGTELMMEPKVLKKRKVMIMDDKIYTDIIYTKDGKIMIEFKDKMRRR